MKNIRITGLRCATLCVSMLLVLFSCNEQEAWNGKHQAGTLQEITFSMKLPTDGKRITRSGEENNVQYVASADIYVFDSQGKLRDLDYGRNLFDASTNGQVYKSFVVKLRQGTGLTVMALINASDIVRAAYPAGVPLDGSVTREEFSQRLTVSYPSGDKWAPDASPAGAGDPIPMWGIKENVTIDESTALSGISGIKVTRMLSLITVQLDDTIDPENFWLTSVRLYNYNSCGRLLPDTDQGNWTAAEPKATGPSLPLSPGFTATPAVYENMTTPGREIAGKIYAFEAAEGSREGYSTNTCLVFGGLYEGVEYYYKADFVKKSNGSTSYLPLLRNYHYIVTIRKITGPGFYTPEDALNSLPYNIEATVLDWNNAGMDGVEIDGQNYLRVSSVKMEFWSDASSNHQFSVTTDHPNGWSYEITDSPQSGGQPINWLQVTSRTDNGPDSEDVLSFELDQNTSGNNRTGYIHITAGRLLVVVHISQVSWVITAVDVDAAESVSSYGEQRTVTLWGTFPDIPFRAYDITRDIELVSSVIPGDNSWSSTTITIPDLWYDGTITIVYQYQDFESGQWKDIITEPQMGYHFTIELDLEDNQWVPRGGITVTGTITGNWPYIVIRDPDSWSYVGILGGQGIAPISGMVYQNINWVGRTMDMHLYYDSQIIQANMVVNLQQGGYFIDQFSFDHPEGEQIPAEGATYTLNITGDYPWFIVYVKTLNPTYTVNRIDIPTGNAGQYEITIAANYTGKTRTVEFSHNLPSMFDDTVFPNTGLQPATNFTLTSTGRVVALADASRITYKWAEAMGLPSSYGGIYLNNPYNYLPTANSGCGAYSEPGYPALSWKLATNEELLEIYQNRQYITNFTGNTYWSSVDVDNDTAYMFSTTNGSFVQRSKKDWTSYYIRCVRDPD